jgi:hypothetical protein
MTLTDAERHVLTNKLENAAAEARMAERSDSAAVQKAVKLLMGRLGDRERDYLAEQASQPMAGLDDRERGHLAEYTAELRVLKFFEEKDREAREN